MKSNIEYLVVALTFIATMTYGNTTFGQEEDSNSNKKVTIKVDIDKEVDFDIDEEVEIDGKTTQKVGKNTIMKAIMVGPDGKKVNLLGQLDSAPGSNISASIAKALKEKGLDNEMVKQVTEHLKSLNFDVETDVEIHADDDEKVMPKGIFKAKDGGVFSFKSADVKELGDGVFMFKTDHGGKGLKIKKNIETALGGQPGNGESEKEIQKRVKKMILDKGNDGDVQVQSVIIESGGSPIKLSKSMEGGDLKSIEAIAKKLATSAGDNVDVRIRTARKDDHDSATTNAWVFKSDETETASPSSDIDRATLLKRLELIEWQIQELKKELIKK